MTTITEADYAAMSWHQRARLADRMRTETRDLAATIAQQQATLASVNPRAVKAAEAKLATLAVKDAALRAQVKASRGTLAQAARDLRAAEALNARTRTEAADVAAQRNALAGELASLDQSRAATATDHATLAAERVAHQRRQADAEAAVDDLAAQARMLTAQMYRHRVQLAAIGIGTATYTAHLSEARALLAALPVDPDAALHLSAVAS